MELHKIKIENFKGIKSFEQDFQGENVTISGTNGAGKTTVMDVVSWILIDKDSSGSSPNNFAIKPVTEDGDEIHRIETFASIELRDESWDEPVELKKIFKEKWTKHNSSEHEELTSHTTKYFINGFSKKEKEYKEFVSTNIISEEMLWLLSDPLAFNSLPWKKAREILNDMADPISDHDIIRQEGFESLYDIITKEATIDDIRKKISDEKTRMDEEKAAIPHRIDELYNSIKEVKEVSDEDIEKIDKQMEELDSELTYLKKKSDEGKSKERIYEIEKQIDHIEKAIERAKKEEKESLIASISRLKAEADHHRDSQERAEKALDQQEEELKRINDKIENKKKEYYEEKDKMFTEESLVYCPVCGQNMPSEIRAYKVEELNEKKAARIEEIKTEGKALKEKKNSILENMQSLIKKGEEHFSSAGNIEETVERKTKRYDEVDETVSKDKLEELKSLKEEKHSLENNKTTKEEGETKRKIDKLEEERILLKNKKSDMETMRAEHEASKRTNKRIKDLEKNEKEIAKKIEQLSRQLYEVGLAEIKKAENIQKNINSKFNLAKFSLFKVQVNGGIRPICETTYKGVPFNRGLNNGAKINVGLDIISTLSDHYGVKCPNFIDNAESVLDIIETNSQQIHLAVSKNKKLKVTTNKKDSA